MPTLTETIAKLESTPSSRKAFCDHLIKKHPVYGANGTNPQTQASIGAVVANFFANKNSPASQNAFAWHINTYSPISQYPRKYALLAVVAAVSGIVDLNTIISIGNGYQHNIDLFQVVCAPLFGASVGYLYLAIKRPI